MPSVTDTLQQHAAVIRGLTKSLGQLSEQHKLILQQLAFANQRPRSITEEIDALPGRRMEYVLTDEVDFTAADAGLRGPPLTMVVSQDGPFIMTHYPMFVWRPTAPSNTTNLGAWRPVSSFPLPDQVIDTDIIDLMYEFFDGGTQRALQNAPRGLVMSRPDNLVPLPVPTMFSSNSTVQIYPTYNRILFNGGTPPTAGVLHVDLPGYRCVNL